MKEFLIGLAKDFLGGVAIASGLVVGFLTTIEIISWF